MFEIKCPCDDCERKVEDDWGYLCDLACGQRSAWIHRKQGAKEMREYIKKEIDKYYIYELNGDHVILSIPMKVWREL